MDDDTFQFIARRLAALRQELEARGVECSVSWRSPGGDQAPILQLLAGDLAGINQVKKLEIFPAPGPVPALASSAVQSEPSCVA